MVLEYVTGLLIEEATSELVQGRLSRLIEHGLAQAGAKEYVRQTQERLLVVPILARLRAIYNSQAVHFRHCVIGNQEVYGSFSFQDLERAGRIFSFPDCVAAVA